MEFAFLVCWMFQEITQEPNLHVEKKKKKNQQLNKQNDCMSSAEEINTIHIQEIPYLIFLGQSFTAKLSQ